MLSQVVDAALMLSGGDLDEWLMAIEPFLPRSQAGLTPEFAQFIKENVRTALVRKNKARPIRLDWLLRDDEPLSEAKAYFTYHALALHPELFTPNTEARLRAALANGSYYAEFIGS
jgi:hypothetical protein